MRREPENLPNIVMDRFGSKTEVILQICCQDFYLPVEKEFAVSESFFVYGRFREDTEAYVCNDI
ncbi:hypothetical protein [Gabonibacter massiliensis]|uniref:hypothetical protein n=1 Tax=Gabonibacter massiliensis TaxID=1720195 RepID=UPI00073F2AC9|nr:hypothetical protein [Gabonibacter massiliensis]